MWWLVAERMTRVTVESKLSTTPPSTPASPPSDLVAFEDEEDVFAAFDALDSKLAALAKLAASEKASVDLELASPYGSLAAYEEEEPAWLRTAGAAAAALETSASVTAPSTFSLECALSRWQLFVRSQCLHSLAHRLIRATTARLCAALRRWQSYSRHKAVERLGAYLEVLAAGNRWRLNAARRHQLHVEGLEAKIKAARCAARRSLVLWMTTAPQIARHGARLDFAHRFARLRALGRALGGWRAARQHAHLGMVAAHHAFTTCGHTAMMQWRWFAIKRQQAAVMLFRGSDAFHSSALRRWVGAARLAHRITSNCFDRTVRAFKWRLESSFAKWQWKCAVLRSWNSAVLTADRASVNARMQRACITWRQRTSHSVAARLRLCSPLRSARAEAHRVWRIRCAERRLEREAATDADAHAACIRTSRALGLWCDAALTSNRHAHAMRCARIQDMLVRFRAFRKALCRVVDGQAAASACSRRVRAYRQREALGQWRLWARQPGTAARGAISSPGACPAALPPCTMKQRHLRLARGMTKLLQWTRHQRIRAALLHRATRWCATRSCANAFPALRAVLAAESSALSWRQARFRRAHATRRFVRALSRGATLSRSLAQIIARGKAHSTHRSLETTLELWHVAAAHRCSHIDACKAAKHVRLARAMRVAWMNIVTAAMWRQKEHGAQLFQQREERKLLRTALDCVATSQALSANLAKLRTIAGAHSTQMAARHGLLVLKRWRLRKAHDANLKERASPLQQRLVHHVNRKALQLLQEAALAASDRRAMLSLASVFAQKVAIRAVFSSLSREMMRKRRASTFAVSAVAIQAAVRGKAARRVSADARTVTASATGAVVTSVQKPQQQHEARQAQQAREARQVHERQVAEETQSQDLLEELRLQKAETLADDQLSMGISNEERVRSFSTPSGTTMEGVAYACETKEARGRMFLTDERARAAEAVSRGDCAQRAESKTRDPQPLAPQRTEVSEERPRHAESARPADRTVHAQQVRSDRSGAAFGAHPATPTLVAAAAASRQAERAVAARQAHRVAAAKEAAAKAATFDEVVERTRRVRYLARAVLATRPGTPRRLLLTSNSQAATSPSGSTEAVVVDTLLAGGPLTLSPTSPMPVSIMPSTRVQVDSDRHTELISDSTGTTNDGLLPSSLHFPSAALYRLHAPKATLMDR